jgi:hypothetical protein
MGADSRLGSAPFFVVGGRSELKPEVSVGSDPLVA